MRWERKGSSYPPPLPPGARAHAARSEGGGTVRSGGRRGEGAGFVCFAVLTDHRPCSRFCNIGRDRQEFEESYVDASTLLTRGCAGDVGRSRRRAAWASLERAASRLSRSHRPPTDISSPVMTDYKQVPTIILVCPRRSARAVVSCKRQAIDRRADSLLSAPPPLPTPPSGRGRPTSVPPRFTRIIRSSPKVH